MSKIPVGYSLNDCPPIKETVPLSIQQIVVLVFNVLPVPLLIGAGIGLSASEITILVAGCLLVTGIATAYMDSVPMVAFTGNVASLYTCSVTSTLSVSRVVYSNSTSLPLRV